MADGNRLTLATMLILLSVTLANVTFATTVPASMLHLPISPDSNRSFLTNVMLASPVFFVPAVLVALHETFASM